MAKAHRDSRARVEEDQVAIRRAHSMKLRDEGKTFRAIAAKTGVSPRTAFLDVKHELEALAEVSQGYAQHHVQEELRRIDIMWAALQPGLKSRTLSIRNSAVKSGVSLSERRARLLGMDHRYEVKKGNTEVHVVMHIPPVGPRGVNRTPVPETIETTPVRGALPVAPVEVERRETEEIDARQEGY